MHNKEGEKKESLSVNNFDKKQIVMEMKNIEEIINLTLEGKSLNPDFRGKTDQKDVRKDSPSVVRYRKSYRKNK